MLVEKFGGTDDVFDEKDFSIKNATFYFSHSEAVLPFLRLLELYRSIKLDRFGYWGQYYKTFYDGIVIS